MEVVGRFWTIAGQRFCFREHCRLNGTRSTPSEQTVSITIICNPLMLGADFVSLTMIWRFKANIAKGLIIDASPNRQDQSVRVLVAINATGGKLEPVTTPTTRNKPFRADWRDSKAYPPPECADMAWLAWEFLRRSKRYAEHVHQMLALPPGEFIDGLTSKVNP